MKFNLRYLNHAKKLILNGGKCINFNGNSRTSTIKCDCFIAFNSRGCQWEFAYKESIKYLLNYNKRYKALLKIL
jgi:hypothetical protein